MSELGSVNVKIETDATKLSTGLSEATRNVQSFATQAKSHIVATVGEIASTVKEIVTFLPEKILDAAHAVGQLYDQTEKLGITVKAFQELDFAAGKAGLSTEGLQQSMFILQKNIGEGSASTVTALTSVGLRLSDIKNLSADQQFLLVSEALGKVKNRSDQATAGFDLMGRGFKDAAGLINSNIKETIGEFDKLGLSLTQTDAAAADAFDETKEALGKVFENFVYKVTANVSPAFTTLIQQVTEFITQSGGLDKIADKFATGIVNGLTLAVKAAEVLYQTITFIADKMSKIQGTKLNNSKGNGTSDGILPGLEDINGNNFAQHPYDTIVSGISGAFEEGARIWKDTAGEKTRAEVYGGSYIEPMTPWVEALKSTIPSIKSFMDNVKMAGTSLSTLKDITKSAVDGAKGSIKGDDAFSQALLSQNGVQDQIDRIVKGSSTNKVVAKDDTFDMVASTLLTRLRSGVAPDNADIKQGLADLNRWATAQDGLDHKAQKNALDELYKYINNTTGQKVDVQLTVTPTPYAMIEWSNSPNGKKIIQGVQAQRLSEAAAASANR